MKKQITEEYIRVFNRIHIEEMMNKKPPLQ